MKDCKSTKCVNPGPKIILQHIWNDPTAVPIFPFSHVKSPERLTHGIRQYQKNPDLYCKMIESSGRVTNGDDYYEYDDETVFNSQLLGSASTSGSNPLISGMSHEDEVESEVENECDIDMIGDDELEFDIQDSGSASESDSLSDILSTSDEDGMESETENESESVSEKDDEIECADYDSVF